MKLKSDLLMEAREASFSYVKNKPVLNAVSLELRRGEILGVVGPNGVGKSTSLKILSGYIRPLSGEILLGGVPVRDMSDRERARRLALVPQNVYAPVPFSVADVIRMGRRARLSRFSRLSFSDHEVIADTIDGFELGSIAERPISELSGGERQKTMIAAALAQEPEVLLLDEPTSHLDIGNSARVMQTLLEWRRVKNASLLLVTHDVQTAARCCDRIIMLSGGSVLTQGRPSEVLTVDILRQVYGRGVVMHTNPDDNLPVILPELNAVRVSAETKE